MMLIIFGGKLLWKVFSNGWISSMLNLVGLNIIVLFMISVGIRVVKVLFSG